MSAKNFEHFCYPNHPQCQRGGLFALSTYSRKVLHMDRICPTPSGRIAAHEPTQIPALSPGGAVRFHTAKNRPRQNSGPWIPCADAETETRCAEPMKRRSASHRSFRGNSPPGGVNGKTGANKLRFMDLCCGIGGFRLASELSPSTLAYPLASATLARSELDREHSTLAGDDCRGARTHSLGTHSATGRVVHGVRTRTR